MKRKLYIIVRRDRDFSTGKLIVHGAHIATDIAYRFSRDLRVLQWFNEDQTKIVLQCKDFIELSKYYEKAGELKIKFISMIADSGFYEVEEGTILMCGILATQNEAEALGLKKLRLFK